MENPSIEPEILARIKSLVQKYRHRCLWFLKEDFFPSSVESAHRTLDYIEKYGDRNAWQEARELKNCLLKSSNSKSAK